MNGDPVASQHAAGVQGASQPQRGIQQLPEGIGLSLGNQSDARLSRARCTPSRISSSMASDRCRDQ